MNNNYDWCFTCGHFIWQDDSEHGEHDLRSQREQRRLQKQLGRHKPPDLGIHVSDSVRAEDQLA